MAGGRHKPTQLGVADAERRGGEMDPRLVVVKIDVGQPTGHPTGGAGSAVEGGRLGLEP
jgi:hypothetical protein